MPILWPTGNPRKSSSRYPAGAPRSRLGVFRKRSCTSVACCTLWLTGVWKEYCCCVCHPRVYDFCTIELIVFLDNAWFSWFCTIERMVLSQVTYTTRLTSITKHGQLCVSNLVPVVWFFCPPLSQPWRISSSRPALHRRSGELVLGTGAAVLRARAAQPRRTGVWPGQIHRPRTQWICWTLLVKV